MSKCRSGEEDKTWFRSDRIFHTPQGWFFLARDNEQKGPFPTQKDAEAELLLFIRTHEQAMHQKTQ